MTPFGARIRELRRERGVTLKDMADALDVSSAYLSALEHGRRGRPTWALMQSILQYFNIIWDEADELLRLAELSHPRIVIDTAGLSPEATLLANRLARDIGALPPVQVRRLLLILGERDEDAGPATQSSEKSAPDTPASE
ncbi:MAG: helix-turn-helix transcriptional regulator [Chelatococcus sp.]|uniref:helix-turn-helix domain-containing protein n=1 Tax=unclassified Chelatococcus TaxID=2638111 RepID=UPI001BCF2F68|nr:helix-turn-helix domain-containing protein [Chelatococcus sp.]MBS7740637.1 helix-turn-helix transcriptional regulator [Chelatococcus sp. HY11]CAH1657124.1 Transcriptional regulator [Hyphomicrobiales bacterium]MBX3537284.1 helix-turn-helix transcriptional regulator [Chelatococcus sp.]MBX3544579.1 helix-turn-helix transcriptional regulator [Chelatococcus sp.]MCO5079876.1 helix-turn-helix domain-containing protein [Chelatococcus sp.]